MACFKKIFSFILLLCLIFNLASCAEKGNESSDTSNITADKSESGIVENISSVLSADDNEDPENTENDIGEGEKVKAEQLIHKTGVANGIDVSKWQGKIDWNKVKNSGIDFAIIRIGYRGENGKLYRDANADYNIQQAQKVGILVGVYFFSTAISTAESKEEASFTLSAIKGYSISYPVVYDCEGYANAGSRMYSLTAEQRTNNAVAFLSEVKNSGYDAMFYAAKSDLQNGSWQTERLEAFKIWLARYTNPPYPETKTPDYQGKYDMWQYTNKGSVNGISGNTDMVVSYFTKELQKPKDSSATPETAQAPKTEEELVYTDVNETVTAKDIVNLRIGAGTNFDIVGTLKNGEKLTRTGVGKNGWSRLKKNGKTVYAITSYLTTDLSYETVKEDIVAGKKFTPFNDSVTAKIETNLRSLPNTDSEIVGSLKSGEFLKRTAKSDSGWSRLSYKGKTVYAMSSLLSNEVIKQPESNVSSTVPSNNESYFKEVSEQVTAKEETNLRTAPTTIDSSVVYTLKKGEYIERIGICEAGKASGWSKLIYNGQTVYAITNYLEK